MANAKQFEAYGAIHDWGDVRTTREEFTSLGTGAWWLHQTCMRPEDWKDYYGIEPSPESARAEAETNDAARAKKEAEKQAAQAAAVEQQSAAAKADAEAAFKGMTVKQLKGYLKENGIDFAGCVEKSDLMAKAAPLIGSDSKTARIGPAYLNGACSQCKKPCQGKAGVHCWRRRPDGTTVGCDMGICWICMTRAPRYFGEARTTAEEFEELGAEAWWMHSNCMEPEDEEAYFG
jgi:hypothetical protein